MTCVLLSMAKQSLCHERVLTRMLERLGIAGRTQKQLDIHHVVMLHPKAIIERPAMKSFDTGNIIKADQFPTWHKNFMESIGVGKLFKTVLNLQNVGTIKEWGERLLRQHRPDDLLALPDFMRPSEYPPTTASTPRVLSSTAIVKAPPHQTEIKTLTNASPFTEERARRLVCARCAVKISFAEGKFCWNNSKRFGGLAYCREHQVLTN